MLLRGYNHTSAFSSSYILKRWFLVCKKVCFASQKLPFYNAKV
ncbi:hypothetical protein HMPREF9144_0192 [Prevotella pallens ATCC 700821]|uniref:Uncharacterized protein n=1 Tax=Prevotella pallens ATCC 700821 TaxID=997353 RepID=F9DEV2_9BACT|nr:hypothetical protein HMPREF9144_0192 [Prevotella pallens ATCC 700821]